MDLGVMDILNIFCIVCLAFWWIYRFTFGSKKDDCFRDCINCANCYSGNQRGGPCDECVGGSNYEEIRGGCDEKNISSN